jgi:hypothetical protein
MRTVDTDGGGDVDATSDSRLDDVGPRTPDTGQRELDAAMVTSTDAFGVDDAFAPQDALASPDAFVAADALVPPDAFTSADAPPSYPVLVTVRGLVGGGLVLRNNGTDDLTVSPAGGADVTRTFTTPLLVLSSYHVTVSSQPLDQSCAVAGVSMGTVTGPVNVEVLCTLLPHTIGGELFGLGSGSITLTNNGGNALTLSANASFTFTAPLTSGSPYAVAISSLPAAHQCTVTRGAGVVMGANVTDVRVDCSPSGARVLTFTGAAETFDVPPGVTQLTIVALGAGGGSGGGIGGRGGQASGVLGVSGGEVLVVHVGGRGGPGGPGGGSRDGGFNGGGAGGERRSSTEQHGGGGGGASDVRRSGGTLADRVIVAGGGGGGAVGMYRCGSGGGGGGYYGGGGGSGAIPNCATDPARGGTQTSGGAPGTPGPGVAGTAGTLGSGGVGGDYLGSVPPAYGGFGGAGGGVVGGDAGCLAANSAGGGGGGSSYVGGVTGGSTVTGGGSTGHGQVTISW